MQLNDPEIENTIKNLFSSEIQQKRIRKELQGIGSLNQTHYKITLQPTHLGLKILIELPQESLQELIKDPITITFPVIFEIFLDTKFPFASPRLYCKTDFHQPSLADGRDFIDDVVEQLWTPAVLLKDVILMLLRFVKKINRLASPEENQALGKYYVDKIYDLEDFLTMSSVVVFPAKEVLEKGKSEERYLVVADSFFLNLSVTDKKTNSVKLVSFANIKSIANIKKNKDDTKTLVFTFHDKSKKSGIAQSVYVVEEANKLVEVIINIGKKYGMKVNKTVKKLQDLSLEDVTAKSYESVDIEELLENITILESKLESELSVDVINLLMTLYQKTIEYFSAFNDPAFEDFVGRLHSLLNRKDVQLILQSQEEVQKTEDSKRKGSGSRKSRDYDEEEEKKEGPAPVHKREEEKARVNSQEGERRKGSKEEQVSKEEWNKGQSQEETGASGIDLGDTV